MFDDMSVQEICAAIAEAYYAGFNGHAKTLCMELTERLENTSI